MRRTSQIVAGILLIPYIGCGVGLCVLIWERKHCDSTYYYTFKSDDGDAPEAEASHDNRYCAGGYHGLLSLIGTLLIGFTIIIYRLLIGMRTRTVKYIHMCLHSITLILFSCGLWCIFSHEYSITYDRINYHGLTSWIVFVMFCIQFLVAAIIYTYQYPNRKVRLYVAPFHDMLGIWLFICCVACCISGRRRAQLDYAGSNQELFYGLSYVCFTFILIIILSPFYEWDVVGEI